MHDMLDQQPIGLILATALALPFFAAELTMPQNSTKPEQVLIERLRKMVTKNPLTVAHRGDSGAHPENTLPAFQSAVRVGAEMVELDFRQTSDGVLVCMHDATLDRTTDSETVLGKKDLKVQDVTSKDIKRLDAGSWRSKQHRGTAVPSLGEALDTIQTKSITMIEHKAGEASKLVELLQTKEMVEDVLVQSFQWEWLETFHKLEPRTAIAALGSGKLTDARIKQLEKTGATIVHWSYRDLTLEDVARLHAKGYLVCTYTVDPDLSLMGAVAGGIDLVTTNRPGRLRELISTGDLRRSMKAR